MNTTKRGIGGIQVRYQTNTDAVPFETLYAGNDLGEASKAALECGDKATIYHYTFNGSTVVIQHYDKGQATRGYANA